MYFINVAALAVGDMMQGLYEADLWIDHQAVNVFSAVFFDMVC